MGDSDLTTVQASQLQFLKQQVDKHQGERYRRDAPTSVENDLFVARQNLNNFVKNLREKGTKI